MANQIQALRQELICPLSFELFKDPRIENNSCGHTFEKSWIEEWLSENQTCPLSRNQLTKEDLVPHIGLRDACAILSPERVDPITDEDWDNTINPAIESYRERRLPQPVSEEIHQSLLKKIQAKIKESFGASREASKNLCGRVFQ